MERTPIEDYLVVIEADQHLHGVQISIGSGVCDRRKGALPLEDDRRLELLRCQDAKAMARGLPF
jgi:hypothetical protein